MNSEHMKAIKANAAFSTRSCPELTQDCYQEGCIAFWTAWQSRPGNVAYCLGASRLRIQGIIRGDRTFGAPPHQGRQQVPINLLSGDDTLEAYAHAVEETTPIVDDVNYACDEIMSVVESLTDSQQKIVKSISFGELLTDSQRGVWNGRLRPRMRHSLAHLEKR